MFEHGLTRMERQRGQSTVSRGITQEQLSSALKQISDLDPASSQEEWRAKKKPTQKRSNIAPSFISTLTIDPLFEIQTVMGQVDVNQLVNINNPLQILYTKFKYNETLRSYISSATTKIPTSSTAGELLEIFTLLDSQQTERAKKLCFQKILKKDPESLTEHDLIHGDTYFVQGIAELFPLFQISNCGKNCAMSKSRKIYPFKDFLIREPTSISHLLNPSFVQHCVYCDKKDRMMRYVWAATGAIPMLAYAVDLAKCALQKDEIPLFVLAVGVRFDLFAITFMHQAKFYSIFLHGGKMYLHSPGSPVVIIRELPKGHRVCSIYFLRKDT